MNLKRLAAPLLLFVCLVGSASAQDVTNPAAARITTKIKQLMLLNMIDPLLMTKDQVKKLLPTVEKARAAERRLTNQEFDTIKKNESLVDQQLKAAKSGRITTAPEKDKIRGMLDSIGASRGNLIYSYTEAVRQAMMDILDKGQIKAATNAFEPKWFDSKIDDSKMTDDQKLRLFIRMIILDPEAYPLLVELSK